MIEFTKMDNWDCRLWILQSKRENICKTLPRMRNVKSLDEKDSALVLSCFYSLRETAPSPSLVNFFSPYLVNIYLVLLVHRRLILRIFSSNWIANVCASFWIQDADIYLPASKWTFDHVIHLFCLVLKCFVCIYFFDWLIYLRNSIHFAIQAWLEKRIKRC